MDITFGLTMMMWLAIAIVAGILGWGYVNLGLSAQGKKGLKVIAVASVLIATVAGGYWATDEAAPTGSITGVMWDAEVSSTDTHVVEMSGSNTFKILCTWDVSDAALTAASDDATFTVTVNRDDTEIVDAVVKCSITDYGTKTNVSTSQSYDGIEKNADGTFNVIYTSSQSTNTTDDITVPYDKTLSGDTFTLLLTPNANAIAACTLQGGYTVTGLFAGEVFTFEFIHYATQA